MNPPISPHFIDFAAMPWISSAPGQRHKFYDYDGQRLRIMEISPAFVESGWCLRGHIGMVLEGEMELAFDGNTQTYHPGDGFVIPPGQTDRHRARALSAVVRVVMVEVVTS